MKLDINFAEFAEKIEIKFNDITLLKRALTHRSYLNETTEKDLSHNERLEFLGDAVLELVVTEYLFSRYLDKPEGELTSFRSALVRTESLAETSLRLGLGDYLLMSKGEDRSGGRRRPYILANALEAVIGAIYLDQGYQVAKLFLETKLIPKISEIVAKRLDIDNKSKLQELSQDILSYTPTYKLVRESGPDHDKTFQIAVVIAGKEFGKGKGHNKQEAEQKAAQKALQNWDQLVADLNQTP